MFRDDDCFCSPLRWQEIDWAPCPGLPSTLGGEQMMCAVRHCGGLGADRREACCVSRRLRPWRRLRVPRGAQRESDWECADHCAHARGGCVPRRCWRVVCWRHGAVVARSAVLGRAVSADGAGAVRVGGGRCCGQRRLCGGVCWQRLPAVQARGVCAWGCERVGLHCGACAERILVDGGLRGGVLFDGEPGRRVDAAGEGQRARRRLEGDALRRWRRNRCWEHAELCAQPSAAAADAVGEPVTCGWGAFEGCVQ
ncbi:dispersed gene family protein 1 (DGF-1), putative [Trypanosoma cruzi]|nr:dispersed gene family protein 1 (DGF-1), putative [Trypanosoma cruzi]